MTTSKPEISSLPTGQPVPSSTPPVPAPKGSPVPITALLAAAPADLDAFLAHLHRCLQTPSGVDCVLQFVCYGSRLSAAILTALSQNALRRSSRELVALAFALPPRTAVLFASAGPTVPATAASARALLVAQRLKALSGLLSEARVMSRLWGLLGMYFWARRLIVGLISARRRPKTSEADKDAAADAPPAPSAAVAALGWVQLASCIIFQALENGAYLSSKGVMSWEPARQGSAMRWSSRFWGLFVGIELGKLAAEATRDGARARAPDWRKNVARYLAWSPLIAHWGSEKGFIGEMGIGLLACVPSIIQMNDLWKSTAATA
ncbi:hypothetical protein RB594_001372 [Gaeumannomyces avenae]